MVLTPEYWEAKTYDRLTEYSTFRKYYWRSQAMPSNSLVPPDVSPAIGDPLVRHLQRTQAPSKNADPAREDCSPHILPEPSTGLACVRVLRRASLIRTTHEAHSRMLFSFRSCPVYCRLSRKGKTGRAVLLLTGVGNGLRAT